MKHQSGGNRPFIAQNDDSAGRFRTARAQRAHSANNYYVVYRGNTPENHPPTEACMIKSKQPGVQKSGPWDPWLPVVENSWLLAQHTVRPLQHNW